MYHGESHVESGEIAVSSDALAGFGAHASQTYVSNDLSHGWAGMGRLNAVGAEAKATWVSR